MNVAGKSVSHLKLLEHNESKLENFDQVFQLSIVFHTRHSELSITKLNSVIKFSVEKELLALD